MQNLISTSSGSTPLVSVIVVNWNGRHFLGPCLRALARQTYPSIEVVLVDNGSSDGSVEYVQSEFPWVRVLALGENRGFAAANNTGIALATGTLIATLNNDTEAEPEWLAQLVRAMLGDQRLGMCATKMLYAHNPAFINSAGIALDVTGVSWDAQNGERDQPEDCQVRSVFGPCAGAALYRREMFREIGAFDAEYFMYLEDVDLAWRGQNAGWRCVLVPTARVRHIGSGSSSVNTSNSRKADYLRARNKIWTLLKNYPLSGLLLLAPLLTFYDLATLPYGQLLQGEWSHLSGRLAAFSALPTLLAKRRAIRPCRKGAGLKLQDLLPPRSPLASRSRARDIARILGKKHS